MADTYHFDYLVIHGPESLAKTNYSSSAKGWGGTSHNGNPAICMELTVSDFTKTADNKTASCKITKAILQALRPESLGVGFGYPFTVSACLFVGKLSDYTGTAIEKMQKMYNAIQHKAFHSGNNRHYVRIGCVRHRIPGKVP